MGEQLVSRLANTDMAVLGVLGELLLVHFTACVCVSVVYAVESLVLLLLACHLRAANGSLQRSVKTGHSERRVTSRQHFSVDV